MGFILAEQGSRGRQTNGDEEKFPENKRFDTVSAMTNGKQSSIAKMHASANIRGLEHISLVKNCVAE